MGFLSSSTIMTCLFAFFLSLLLLASPSLAQHHGHGGGGYGGHGHGGGGHGRNGKKKSSAPIVFAQPQHHVNMVEVCEEVAVPVKKVNDVVIIHKQQQGQNNNRVDGGECACCLLLWCSVVGCRRCLFGFSIFSWLFPFGFVVCYLVNNGGGFVCKRVVVSPVAVSVFALVVPTNSSCYMSTPPPPMCFTTYCSLDVACVYLLPFVLVVVLVPVGGLVHKYYI
eukprot:GHVS01063386.1.p1 GENE.GHVS01063386.1~~GHVS01063386.1.p1  ORF type:complete len:223 (-),score=63.95 GHVS01063386.1:2-670(-)